MPQSTFNDLSIIKELGSILRGEHITYRGDKRVNGAHFLRGIAKQFPDKAVALASHIERKPLYFCDQCNISERSVLMAARVLKGTMIDM